MGLLLISGGCQDKYVVRLDSSNYCLEIRNYHKKQQKQYSIYGLCVISISEYCRGTINSGEMVPLVRSNLDHPNDYPDGGRGWVNFPYNHKLARHHDLSQDEIDNFIKKMLALFLRKYDQKTNL